MNAPPCVGAGVDFHAESRRERAAAAAICLACPVRLACLQGALSREEAWGVWGGRDFTRRRGRLDRPPCGTKDGYHAHRRRAEPPCALCAPLVTPRAPYPTSHVGRDAGR